MRLFPLLIALLLAACGGSPEVDALLAVADSLSGVKPDSALRLLQQQEAGVPHWSKSQRMRHALLTAKAMNKAYVPLTADSLMTVVADYYDSHGTPNEQMEAHYLLGCTYRDLGEAPAALAAYQDAIDRADTTAQDCDYIQLSKIYGQMGELFYWQNLLQSASWSYGMGELNAMKSRDSLLAIVYYEQKAKCYYDMGKPDSMEIVIKKARKLYLQYGDTLSANTVIGPLVFLSVKNKQYEQAARFINIYGNNSRTARDTLLYQESWGQFKIHTGYYYLGLHRLDSAIHYLHSGLALVQNPYNVTMAFEGLYDTYKELGVSDSIVKYAEKSIQAKDSTVNTHITDQMQRVQALYNYDRFRLESDKLSMEAGKAKQKVAFLSLVLTGFVLFSVVIFTILIIHFLRKRIKRQRLKVKYAADTLLFKSFNEELSRSSNQPAQKQAIEEKLQFLKDSLSKQAKDLNTEIITDSFQESDIVAKIRAKGAEGKILPDAYWSSLRQAINVYAPLFMDSLAAMNCNLDLSDTHICQLALIRNMPQKAKASVMGLEYHAAAMKRKRLFKALFGKDGSARDLEVSLQEIAFGCL